MFDIEKIFIFVHFLFDPFFDYGYMSKAITACCALSFSSVPIGGFLMLKRMSLIGDVLSHAMLPGLVIGYFFSGMSLIGMTIGGLFCGVVVAVISSWINRTTELYYDASFSGIYLGSLSLGIILLSCKGSNIDLCSLLFGSILSINIFHLKVIGVISAITILILIIFYRVLVIETFDAEFLYNSNIKLSKFVHMIFLFIVVLNLVASFQVTGSLLSIGLMMLPGFSARFWVKKLSSMLLLSVFISLFCSWIGLLSSFYMSLPVGPTIVFFASLFFFISIFFGKNKGILCMIYYKNK